MSKDIWHTGKEIPDEDQYIVVKNKAGLYSVDSEFEYDLDRVEKWAYFDDFLALETELERTREALGIAVRAIKTIKYSKKSDAINLRHKANKALIEIYKIKDQTALEQKDTK